jgi:hypothetical protein
MSWSRLAAAALVVAVVAGGCGYIVVPDEEEGNVALTGEGWSAVPIEIAAADGGGTRVLLAIRNDSGAWSTMEASEAAITTAAGATEACDTVVVGSGGHRVAPGMEMRGFTGGTRMEPVTELLRVECAGVEPSDAVAAGSRLAIGYDYYVGLFNYYDPEATRKGDRLEVARDAPISAPLNPGAEAIEGIVVGPDAGLHALNDVTLRLIGVERDGDTLRLSWETANPGEYPTFVHIGSPPILGAAGIVHGRYESPDLASVPVTPAGATATWTTETLVPADDTDLHVLLSVEWGKQRQFTYHAIALGE